MEAAMLLDPRCWDAQVKSSDPAQGFPIRGIWSSGPFCLQVSSLVFWDEAGSAFPEQVRASLQKFLRCATLRASGEATKSVFSSRCCAQCAGLATPKAAAVAASPTTRTQLERPSDKGASCESRGGVMASSSSTVNVSGAEGAEKTVIHVNITQESSLGSLLKALAAWRQTPKPGPKDPQGLSAPPTRAGCNAEQKVLGGTQILLGLVTIGIGYILSLGLGTGYYGCWIFRPIWNGCPYWSGGVLFVAGVLSIVGDRRGGCWVHLATFSHLASIVACSMALAAGEADLPSLNFDSYSLADLCRSTQYKDGYYQPWGATTPIPEDTDRVQRCEEMIQNLWRIAAGLRILLFVLCIGALVIAIFCLGNGLRRLCCSFLGRCENYSPLEDPEVPPPYEEPAKEENAA